MPKSKVRRVQEQEERKQKELGINVEMQADCQVPSTRYKLRQRKNQECKKSQKPQPNLTCSASPVELEQDDIEKVDIKQAANDHMEIEPGDIEPADIEPADIEQPVFEQVDNEPGDNDEVDFEPGDIEQAAIGQADIEQGCAVKETAEKNKKAIVGIENGHKKKKNVQMKSSSGMLLTEGMVVWGRFGRSTWFPALIVDDLVRRTTRHKYVWLFWLSDYTISQVSTHFIGLKNVTKADSLNISNNLVSLLDGRFGDAWRKRMVAMGTDGAAVMLGKKSGVVQRIRDITDRQFIFAVHCSGHRRQGVRSRHWSDLSLQYRSKYPNLFLLVDFLLTLPASSVDAERGFSKMKIIKNDWRSRLGDKNLTDLLLVDIVSEEVDTFDPTAAIHMWSSTGSRRPYFNETHTPKVKTNVMEPFWVNFREHSAKNKQDKDIQQAISVGLMICSEKAGVDKGLFSDILEQWGMDSGEELLAKNRAEKLFTDSGSLYPTFVLEALQGHLHKAQGSTLQDTNTKGRGHDNADLSIEEIEVCAPCNSPDIQECCKDPGSAGDGTVLCVQGSNGDRSEVKSKDQDDGKTTGDSQEMMSEDTNTFVKEGPSSSRDSKGETNEDHGSTKDTHAVTSSVCNYCMSCEDTASESVNHPLFEGLLCLSCKEAWKVNFFAVDYDNCKLFCVVCSKPGVLYVCDRPSCGKCFCFHCVEKYTSHQTSEMIRSSSTWDCFLCTDYSMATHGRLRPRADWQINIILMFNVGPQPVCDLCYLTAPGKRKIRVLSLFDGIGTGKVALDLLGLQTEVYFASEIYKPAILMTRIHHPEIINIGNVRKLSRQKLKSLCPIDLLIGGPPCNDLSLVNFRRKGFDGTGKLLLRYIYILKLVQAICRHSNHVFWLMESTRCMLKTVRQQINELLGTEAVMWDAKEFTGQRRARLFWGNLPGMCSPADVCKQLEEERTDLQSVLCHGRTALVSHTRTITTNRNSLSRHSGSTGGIIMERNEDANLSPVELERLFGFPSHYTDYGNFEHGRRQRLLGKAWSVPVIKHLLTPLTAYFSTGGQVQ